MLRKVDFNSERLLKASEEISTPAEIIFVNTSRIRQLRMTERLNPHFPPAVADMRVLEKATTPAPNLEKLELCNTNFRPEIHSNFPHVFNGHLPRLRSLIMSGCTSWPFGLFINLISVELKYTFFINAIAFYDFLDSSPEL